MVRSVVTTDPTGLPPPALCLACRQRPAALMHDALLGDLPRLLCEEGASGETRALAKQGRLL